MHNNNTALLQYAQPETTKPSQTRNEQSNVRCDVATNLCPRRNLLARQVWRQERQMLGALRKGFCCHRVQIVANRLAGAAFRNAALHQRSAKAPMSVSAN